MSLVHCTISQDVQSADKTASWLTSGKVQQLWCRGERSTASYYFLFTLHCLEGIFALECVNLSLPQFWWLARTAMKLEEEGLENACGTWTLLAFFVPGAQNCIFGKTKLLAVWVVNFAFCRTTGTHGPLTVAGGHIACCFMLRLPVWCQSIQVVKDFLIEICSGCNSNSTFGN